MYATFTPEGDPALSILQPAHGHALTVNIFAGSKNRVVLLVSDDDYRKASYPERQFQVTELMTGMVHKLRPADCGGGCKCAITFA